MEQQARLTLWVVWGVLLGSLGVYGVLPFLITPSGPGVEADLLAACLGAVALVFGTVSFLLKRKLVREPLDRREIDLATQQGRQRLQMGYVFTWVFAEAVGIFGLVLFFLTHQVGLALPFVTAGAVLMLLHAPRNPAPDAGSPA